ncbi:nuclease-related domain-containing protein [Streptomyces sp. NPDC001205]
MTANSTYAGRSALRHAQALRRAELRVQHRRAARVLPVAAALGFAVTTALGWLPGPLPLLAGLLVPSCAARWLYQPSQDVRHWRQGAAGEQKTARLLRPLARRGWTVLHDRAIPGSTANVDHLLLLPDGLGAVLVDTKTVNPRLRARVTMRGTRVHVGGRNFARQAETVQWEAEQAAKALGVSVAPVVAIHGARVPRAGIRTPDGLLIVPAARLRHVLAAIPHQRRPECAQRLAERAATALPPYIN